MAMSQSQSSNEMSDEELMRKSLELLKAMDKNTYLQVAMPAGQIIELKRVLFLLEHRVGLPILQIRITE